MPKNTDSITFDELVSGLDGGALNVELSDQMQFCWKLDQHPKCKE